MKTIKRFAFFNIIFLFLSACIHTSKPPNTEYYTFSRQKTWEALVYIFKSYPTRVIDNEKGYIETEILKGSRYWKAPHQKSMNINGLSSVIKVYLYYEKPLTKVTIEKEIFKRKNFISNSAPVPSDFLEEKSILYRLGRELYIRDKFQKISK